MIFQQMCIAFTIFQQPSLSLQRRFKDLVRHLCAQRFFSLLAHASEDTGVVSQRAKEGARNPRKVNPRRNVYPRKPTSNGIAASPSRIMNRDENVYVLSLFALSERLSRTAIILVQKRHAKGAKNVRRRERWASMRRPGLK